MIYYDRKLLFHPTTSSGCRYKCRFEDTPRDLNRGDVAVFSEQFSKETGIKLKRRGVLIAFETGESPQHLPTLPPSNLKQVSKHLRLGYLVNHFEGFETISQIWPHHIHLSLQGTRGDQIDCLHC